MQVFGSGTSGHQIVATVGMLVRSTAERAASPAGDESGAQAKAENTQNEGMRRATVED